MFSQFSKKTLSSKFISGIVAVSFILTSVPVRSYAALGTADKLRTRVADTGHQENVMVIGDELKNAGSGKEQNPGGLVSLMKNSGLDIKLDRKTGKLILGKSIVSEAMWTRPLKDAGNSIANPALIQQDPNREIYYGFRNVRDGSDNAAVVKSVLRYDVTVLQPGLIGEEFVMTKGHNHPVSKEGDTFPEIYEVWHGKALYIQQGINKQTNEFEVLVTIAQAGDKVILKPDYSHRTVIISNEPLIMANWIYLGVGGKKDENGKDIESSILVRPNFAEIEAKNGYSYQVVRTKNGEIGLRHNPKYGPTPAPLRIALPAKSIPEIGLEAGVPMYNLIHNEASAKKLNQFLRLAKGQGFENVFNSAFKEISLAEAQNTHNLVVLQGTKETSFSTGSNDFTPVMFPTSPVLNREPIKPSITSATKPEIFVLSNKISLLRGAMTGGYNIGHAIGENADGGVFNHSEWRAMLEGTLSAVLESLTSVDKHEVAKGAVTLSASAKKDYIERVKRLTNLPEKDIEDFLPEIQKHLLYAQTAKNLQRQIETLARRIVNKAVNNLLKEVIARSNAYPFKQTVVCVGETKTQFDDKRTEEILKQDLEEILAGITQQEAEKIGLRIAYEARWVIGKGVIPPEVFAKVNEIHGFIKQQVGKEALKLTLFVDYGASVNKGNIDKIAVLPNVDGFLIGGAAKLPEEVGQMIDILNFLGLDKRFNFGMNWKAEGEETGLKPVNEFVEILKAKDLSKVQIAISTPNVAPVKNAVAGLIPVKLALLNKFSVYLSVVSSTEEVGLGYSKGIIASSEKAAMNLPFEQLEKLFGEKTKKGDTYFLIGKNNAYFALAKENSVDQTLTVSPTVDLSNPAVLETYYSSLLEYTYLVTTKSQKGLELISIAGNELKLKSFLTKEGAEAEARANSSNIVEEDFVSGNLIGKKRWMGTGLLRDKFFQFEYNIGSPKKGVRPTLLTFKKSKSKLARGWSAIIQPKFTHLIFGFGTIGSEVGKKSREMGFNVVAVNRSPNEKAGLAQSLGIPLYLLSPDDKKAFEKAKIGAEGILEDLLKDGEVDLITDATDGETEDPETGKEITVAAYNTKYIYSKYPNIKVMYEGAEDPKIAGRFFDSGTLNVLKIPYSQIMKDVNSLFFPSCNTTGQGFILDRVASNSKDLVVKVTTGRRANDPGQKGKLSPDGTKIETGYHHADDYLEGREAYPEILNAFRKGAKNKPSLTTDASNTHLTKFHITEMWVSGFDKKTDKRLTAETVKKLLSQEPRISLVDFKKDAFDATLLIDILFNKLGIVHPFTPIVQVLDLADSGDVKITLAVPQESIVIPNNMNGIHALTGLYEREASTRLVNDVMQIAEISQAIESTLPLKSARVKTKESKEVEIPAIPGIVTYTNKQLEDFKSPDGKPVYATLNTDIGDIENGMVSDKQDKKLVEGFDYLERLSKNNALYILGHNGRPAGKYVEKLGLFGVTRWYAFRRAQIYGQGIEEHIGKKDTNGRFIEASYWVIKNYRGSGDVKVWFLPDTDEVSIKRYAQIIKDLKPGDWAIPENRRMDFREQAGDPAGENPTGDPALREAAIKDMLYRGGEELLVGPIGFNFGTADVHRYDARITAAGKFLLLASGENTADFMGRVNKIRSLIGQAHEKGAVALIVSGLKKDKIELLLEAINNVAQKGDKVVVVGAINAYPLAAEGKSTGKMEIKKDALEMWQEVVEAAKAKGVDLYYPKALKVVKDLTTAKKEDIKVIQDGNIPEDYVIGDVDEQGLAEIFKIGEDENVKLVLQAGPVGPFDLNDVLAEGSNKFQQKLVELSLKKKVVSLGSDTQKANKKAGVEGKFPNQFTDGGSFLDALTCPAGEDCPAITALKESAKIYAGVIAKDIEKEAEKVETAADAVMTEN